MKIGEARSYELNSIVLLNLAIGDDGNCFFFKKVAGENIFKRAPSPPSNLHVSLLVAFLAVILKLFG